MNCVLNGISNQEQEPVHDQGNSSPLVNEKAHDDSSDIRKKKAPKKKDKTAEQRKKDQEKQKRFRLRTMYESQIKDTEEGAVGSFSKQVQILVPNWQNNNGFGGGNFQKVTQMTRIGMVRNKAPLHENKNGNVKAYKPHKFFGAIVAFGDPKYRNYEAIPESHFKVKVSCYAKQPSHSEAKPMIADRLTGICETVHVEGRKSEGWVYVQWPNNETQWLPSQQVVGDLVTDNKRERRGPSPAKGNDVIANSGRPMTKPDKDKLHTYYSPFASYVKAHAEEHKKNEKGALGKEEEDMTPEEEVHEWLGSNIPNIAELVSKGDQHWHVSEIVRLYSKIKSVGPRPSPNFETIQTSFLYDVLRGNIRGCIADVDLAFQVGDVERKTQDRSGPSPYIHLICHAATKEKVVRRQKKRKRTMPLCKVNDCKSCVHTQFLKDGVCYHHGEEEKKLCKHCKRTSSRHGGLCRSCYEDRVNKKEKGLCVICQTREPKKTGGKCNICI